MGAFAPPLSPTEQKDDQSIFQNRSIEVTQVGISDRTRKLLWGRSAGRCAWCRRPLFEPARCGDDESIVGDECHIVARHPAGPRGRSDFGGDLDGYENLILLCRTHHKMVDDQRHHFHPEFLKYIKLSHELWVQIVHQNASTEPVSFPIQTPRFAAEVKTFSSPAEAPATTGFYNLDILTGGLYPSELILLGARPGSGKTTFALTITRSAAVLSGSKVIVASVQHSEAEICRRLTAFESTVDTRTIRTLTYGQEEKIRLERGYETLGAAPILILDAPDVSVEGFCEMAPRIIDETGAGIIVLDGLHLMLDIKRDAAETSQLRQALALLKRLARTSQVAVLVTTQVPATVETRQDKRPMLKDLPGVDEIADTVLFLYRESLYTMGSKDPTRTELLELIVAKGPAGSPCSFPVAYIRGRLLGVETRGQT